MTATTTDRNLSILRMYGFTYDATADGYRKSIERGRVAFVFPGSGAEDSGVVIRRGARNIAWRRNVSFDRAISSALSAAWEIK